MRISDFTKLTPEDLKEQEKFNKMLEDEEKRYTLDGDSDDIGEDTSDDLIMVDGVYYIDSRTIAEKLNRRHHHIVRDIRKITEDADVISEKPNMVSLIKSSTYKIDGQNKSYNNFLLTKDGFTLLMFNIQGNIKFKLAYIEKFNLMERTLNNISKVISDVQSEEKNIAIMEIKNHIDSYESENRKLMKKLSEASLFHKKELEFKDVVIGELQDKVKTYSSIEEAIDNLSNGAMSITMSNTMKDKILLVADTIIKSGYLNRRSNKAKDDIWR